MNFLLRLLSVMMLFLIPLGVAIAQSINIGGIIVPELSFSSKVTEKETRVLESVFSAFTMNLREGGLVGKVNLSLSATNGFTNGVEESLNIFYVEYKDIFYSFMIGKNRIKNSVSYAWNPADILNPRKSLLYRDENKSGTVNGTFMAGGGLFYAFEEVPISLKEEVYALPDFLDTITNIRFVNTLTLLAFSVESSFSMGFRLNEEEEKDILYAGYLRFPLPFVDFVTLYGEFANVNFSKKRSYVGGIQLNPNFDFLKGNLQFQWEYFYNQDGYDSLDDFRNDITNLLGGIVYPGTVLKNYFYTGFTYGERSIRCSVGLVKNIDEDQSGMINYSVKLAVGDNGYVKSEGFFLVYDKDEREFSYLVNKKYEVSIGYEMYFDIHFEKKEESI